jgi:hypothetical protein
VALAPAKERLVGVRPTTVGRPAKRDRRIARFSAPFRQLDRRSAVPPVRLGRGKRRSAPSVPPMPRHTGPALRRRGLRRSRAGSAGGLAAQRRLERRSRSWRRRDTSYKSGAAAESPPPMCGASLRSPRYVVGNGTALARMSDIRCAAVGMLRSLSPAGLVAFELARQPSLAAGS